jgi:hypothetical protein
VEGTQVVSGYGISGYTEDSGATDAALVWDVASGIIADEDIQTTTAALDGSVDGYTILYRSGANGDWLIDTGNTLPLKHAANQVQYNQWTGATWQLTGVTEDNFVNYWVFAVPGLPGQPQIVTIAGQGIYPTEDAASAVNIATLSWGTFPFQEAAPLYQVILRYNATAPSAYANTPRAAIVRVTRLVGSRVTITQAAQTDHGALTGLADDDHTQYYLVNGTRGAVANFTSGTISGITDLAVADGGTGASDAATARTNLDAQQADATLTSIAALGTAADRYLYTTGVDTWAEGAITTAGRNLLDDADAAAQRSTLGLGTMATQAANNVNIDGGTIDGTAVNATTLSASGVTNLDAGTVAAPGLILESETGTGLYRIGANNHGYAVSGAKVLDISSTGLGVTGSVTATGATPDVKVVASTTTGTTIGNKGCRLVLQSDTATVGNGGEVVWMASGDTDTERWAAISGHITGNDAGGADGKLIIGVKGSSAATSILGICEISSTGLAVTGSVTPSAGVYLGGSAATNLLDDYEEGTWTPTLNNFGGTNLTASGTYTKIGRMVMLTFSVSSSDSNLALTQGTSTITNLPFAPSVESAVSWWSSNTSVSLGNYYQSGGTIYTPAYSATGSTLGFSATYVTAA